MVMAATHVPPATIPSTCGLSQPVEVVMNTVPMAPMGDLAVVVASNDIGHQHVGFIGVHRRPTIATVYFQRDWRAIWFYCEWSLFSSTGTQPGTNFLSIGTSHSTVGGHENYLSILFKLNLSKTSDHQKEMWMITLPNLSVMIFGFWLLRWWSLSFNCWNHYSSCYNDLLELKRKHFR